MTFQRSTAALSQDRREGPAHIDHVRPALRHSVGVICVLLLLAGLLSSGCEQEGVRGHGGPFVQNHSDGTFIVQIAYARVTGERERLTKAYLITPRSVGLTGLGGSLVGSSVDVYTADCEHVLHVEPTTERIRLRIGEDGVVEVDVDMPAQNGAEYELTTDWCTD